MLYLSKPLKTDHSSDEYCDPPIVIDVSLFGQLVAVFMKYNNANIESGLQFSYLGAPSSLDFLSSPLQVV